MSGGFQGHSFKKIFLMGCILAAVTLIFFMTHEKRVQERAAARKLRAESGASSTDQSVQKFSLTGFDDQGKKFWNLQGDKARIDIGQTVILEENVTLKLKDSTVIKTDHVQWSQDGGILRTPAMVFVTHDNADIKGRGAAGRLSDNFIQLNHDIEMLINKSTLLTCSGPLKIFFKENRMVFYRNVKIVDDRGVLTADRMDVFFDSAQKKVSQVIAVGDVTIERGTDTTHSRRAIYTLATGSIRLEGNPEVTLHKESQKLLNAPLRN